MRISDWSSDVCSSDLAIFLWGAGRAERKKAPGGGTRRLRATARGDRGRECRSALAAAGVGFRIRIGGRAGSRGGMRLELGLRDLADQALRGVGAMGVERRERHIVELAAAHHDGIAAVDALHGADADPVHVGEIGAGAHLLLRREGERSEEHTSELQSLMRTSYAVF